MATIEIQLDEIHRRADIISYIGYFLPTAAALVLYSILRDGKIINLSSINEKENTIGKAAQ